MAPTTEKVSTVARVTTVPTGSGPPSDGSSGTVEFTMRDNEILPTSSATDSTTIDQANHVAVRGLIRPVLSFLGRPRHEDAATRRRVLVASSPAPHPLDHRSRHPTGVTHDIYTPYGQPPGRLGGDQGFCARGIDCNRPEGHQKHRDQQRHPVVGTPPVDEYSHHKPHKLKDLVHHNVQKRIG